MHPRTSASPAQPRRSPRPKNNPSRPASPKEPHNFPDFALQPYLFYKTGGKTCPSVLPNSGRWSTTRFAEMPPKPHKHDQRREKESQKTSASVAKP